jgi:hypothetical protein
MLENRTVYVNTRLSKPFRLLPATFPIIFQQITEWDILNFNTNHYLHDLEITRYTYGLCCIILRVNAFINIYNSGMTGERHWQLTVRSTYRNYKLERESLLRFPNAPL